jgi:hypothetical protein
VVPSVFQFQNAVLSDISGIRDGWAIGIVLDFVGEATCLGADDLRAGGMSA